MNMNMGSLEDNRPTACERRKRDTEDDSDQSGSNSSMVSFEIAFQETTLETCLLDKNNPYYTDNDDEEEAMIRRKYPWRRFKAFLKSVLSDEKKVVSTSVVLLIFVTLAAGSSSSSRRQRRQQQQQQQQGQSVNFAARHGIEHDYFTTDREYVSDYAPINHKCLFVRLRWTVLMLLSLLTVFVCIV